MKNPIFPSALPTPTKGAQPSSACADGRTRTGPCRDTIARKAYLAYLDQGAADGHDVKHWLEAEAALTAHNPASPATIAGHLSVL